MYYISRKLPVEILAISFMGGGVLLALVKYGVFMLWIVCGRIIVAIV